MPICSIRSTAHPFVTEPQFVASSWQSHVGMAAGSRVLLRVSVARKAAKATGSSPLQQLQPMSYGAAKLCLAPHWGTKGNRQLSQQSRWPSKVAQLKFSDKRSQSHAWYMVSLPLPLPEYGCLLFLLDSCCCSHRVFCEVTADEDRFLDTVISTTFPLHTFFVDTQEEPAPSVLTSTSLHHQQRPPIRLA